MLFKRNKNREVCESTETKEPKPMGKFRLFILKVGKRNAIIACAVLLIGAAVWMNWKLFAEKLNPDGFGGYDQPAGITEPPPSEQPVNEKAAYFSSVQVSRQRARDEAIEVLQSVVDNVDADEELRSEALASINLIAQEIQKEANIESLVTAKGFSQCVAVLNGDKVNVVVRSDDPLLPAQIAQIKEIVYTQTGIAPSGVSIIYK